MPYAKPKFFALLLLFVAVLSCKKDSPPPVAVDLSQLRLTDFVLEESPYVNITITHPVVRNGAETVPGEIHVVIPKGVTQGNLTPKATNFTNAGFTVSPRLGQPQNLLNRVVVYTIAANGNAAKAVHYAVTVTEEQTQPEGPPALTSFRFEKAKNAFLPADVEAAKIIDGVASIGKVFVFVPAGTPFSALTATIGFRGTGLFYLQDANGIPENSTTVYPASGMPIDFTYPKVFYAVARSGTAAKTYAVIVDVKNPIRFAAPDVTTADVAAGTLQTVQATTFVNQGNHPVSIIGVDHSNHLPAGIAAVRGWGTVPSGGLLPGQSATVFATISAQTFPAGTYGATAAFQPRLVDHPEADDVLERSVLRIVSKIIP